MASPTPSSPSHAKEHSSDYYYFVAAVAAVAVLLLASNVLVVGCCSRCGLVKRFLQLLGILSSSPEGDRISHVIPSCKYRKEKAAAAESECSVCLMALVEGEEVREMPKCKHLFHAPCIDMWLYSHSNCPMCRADVLPKGLQGHHTTTAAAAREDGGYNWRGLIESGSMTGVVVGML